MKKHWYDYLWIVSLTYLILGFFNILFAWLGLLCFFIPLIISIANGTKGYCNRYCGRGQLFGLLGGRFGLSRKKDIPQWMKSKAFRYGFFNFLFHHVFSNALEYLSGIFQRTEFKTSCNTFMDLQSSLALGIPWYAYSSRSRTVCLRLL